MDRLELTALRADRRRVRAGTSIARQIDRSLQTFPDKFPADDTTCQDFGLCSRSTDFRVLRFGQLQDGMVIIYTSDIGLAHRSHRFIFPKWDQLITYHHESFNVDPQAIASPPLNLTGIEAISLNDKAYSELTFVNSGLAIARSFNWRYLEEIRESVADC